MTNLRATKLTLFIAPNSPASSIALANLRSAFARNAAEHIQLEIVDVFSAPERILTERILVTPTLLADGRPGRVIGDLSDAGLLDHFLQSLATAP
jgi:hypothetical protein